MVLFGGHDLGGRLRRGSLHGESGERLPPAQRFEYLCVVGLVVTHSCPEQGESFEIKDYLVESYQHA